MLSFFNSVKVDGNKSMSLKNEMETFNDPDQVYITASNYNLSKMEILVKKGDAVKMGQVVAKSTENYDLNIHSSVSGTVMDIDKVVHSSGRKIDAIIIKNDKKDTLHKDCIKEENIDLLTPEEIIEKMKKWAVIGRGGSAFPTYIKYSSKKQVNKIILNGVECEPYITADYVTLKKHFDEIIKGLKHMMNAANAMEGIIVIKKHKKELKMIMEKALKDEKNISVRCVANKYPNGWESKVVRSVTSKKYKNLPLEQGVIVNNIATALDVFNAVELNQPLFSKFVTLSGEMVKVPKNYYVRVGTMVKDFIKDNFNEGEKILVSGGSMMGKSHKDADFIIGKRNNSVLMLKPQDKEIVKEVESPCMRCGKCSDHCPANLTPVLIKEGWDLRDKAEIKALNASACVSCGLCSYVCPANIELASNIKKAMLFSSK